MIYQYLVWVNSTYSLATTNATSHPTPSPASKLLAMGPMARTATCTMTTTARTRSGRRAIASLLDHRSVILRRAVGLDIVFGAYVSVRLGSSRLRTKGEKLKNMSDLSDAE